MCIAIDYNNITIFILHVKFSMRKFNLIDICRYERQFTTDEYCNTEVKLPLQTKPHFKEYTVVNQIIEQVITFHVNIYFMRLHCYSTNIRVIRVHFCKLRFMLLRFIYLKYELIIVPLMYMLY